MSHHRNNTVLGHLTCAVGTETSQQLEADVSLHAHGAGMDLEDVSTTLKQHLILYHTARPLYIHIFTIHPVGIIVGS